MTNFYEILMALEKEGKRLDNGIYGIVDIEVERHHIDKDSEQKVKDWLQKYPDGCVIDPYETDTIFLLSKIPRKLAKEQTKGQFNYGAAAIVENCPKRILICAAND